MSAVFGKLQGRTLELKNGLNIIQAPNETGKSTWCAFLLSMLYGINSRERDKAGFIADKNRYAPWSGAVMSGRLDCRVGDEELTLTRITRRQSAPMGEFQAVYAGTGEPVSQLTGLSCGEVLLGVSREVYERSAFIRQAGLPISQDAGLERRIASLITSGEEDTSYSEAADTLKKQLNRRRHNKTGKLPALEAELADIQRQITELETLERQLTDAQQQIEGFSLRETALKEELLLHDRWDAFQKQAALREAETAAEKANAALEQLRQQLQEERIPENETIGRLRGALVNLETTRKAVEKARADRDEAAKASLRAEAALNESPFAGQTAEEARKAVSSVPEIRPRLWWLPVLTAIAGFGISYFIAQGNLALAALAACIGAVLGIFIAALRFSQDKKKQIAYLSAFKAETLQELHDHLETYINKYNVYQSTQAELNKRSAAAESLYASLSSNEQAILLEVRRFAPAAFDSAAADGLLRECAQKRKRLSEAESAASEARMRYELLAGQTPAFSAPQPPAAPSRERSVVAAEYQQTRSALDAARSAADRLTGQLHAVGDGAVLRSAAAHLRQELADTEAEYSAIHLAMETLERANTTLQNRFSPALGRRAAEIFSELTGGRYSGVALDRALHLTAEPAGDITYRDAALLSAGAADQLYLAVRLAICDLVLPQEHAVPIVLDDALANFDDERCAAALRWLKEESKRRQILLFTCHSREGDFFKNDGDVFVQRLTDAG